MQQDTPSGANSKRRDRTDRGGSHDGGEEQNEPLAAAPADMNFDPSLFNHHAPSEHQYEGVPAWMLQPAAGGSHVYAGYAGYTGYGEAMAAAGTPLTPQEQMAEYASMARRTANTEPDAEGKIQDPHMNDVLCGRGGSINSHPGNRSFRGWIGERKDSYNLADTKADKSRITREVMEQVRDQTPAGRFLQKEVAPGRKRDPYARGWWTEIDDAKALAKISQALREGAPAFRAAHGKKTKKARKKESSAKPRRTSGRHQPKKRGARTATERDDRKSPLETYEAPAKSPPMEAKPAAMLAMPAVAAPMPAAATGNGRQELNVLYPTANNYFATARANGNGNGNLLNSYPIVHMGDYTASISEVAGAIPPTPPSLKKLRPSPPPPHSQFQAMPQGMQPGNSTPSLEPAPNTPLVSPGFSPYGQAKAAWDAISFLPNLSPVPGSPLRGMAKPRLTRSHSLSFSDQDVHSVGSFEDPFTDNHLQKPDQVELQAQASGQRSLPFPPPLATDTPPHGLSFGRIGGVPTTTGLIHTRHSSRSTSRSGLREGSVSSKSCGSISNFNSRTKRRSIA